MEPKQSSAPCASILVVEDNWEIREGLRLALEVEGYEVFTAENGQEALEKLASLPRPGCILLDLMMPVMNGFEFLEAVQANDSLATIPVGVLTAYANLAAQVHGAASFMKKPIDIEVLLAFVTKHCG
jgi:CheY-like chemotaxis protein